MASGAYETKLSARKSAAAPAEIASASRTSCAPGIVGGRRTAISRAASSDTPSPRPPLQPPLSTRSHPPLRRSARVRPRRPSVDHAGQDQGREGGGQGEPIPAERGETVPHEEPNQPAHGERRGDRRDQEAERRRT